MIKIENTEVVGWEAAIRGMRNPKNSWDRSDTLHIPFSLCDYDEDLELAKICHGVAPVIKENDHKLMMNLAAGGPVHAKYRRMITVYVDITAPLYWWKEFDTYKVGTVANSCSTMHKIHDKEFVMDDFSWEHTLCKSTSAEDEMVDIVIGENDGLVSARRILMMTIKTLNFYRDKYLEAKVKPMKDESKRKELMKKYWWQMIQLLPSYYNQKRTIMLNYEVLVGMYRDRKNHKLDEWHKFCSWIETLPHSQIITGTSRIADGGNCVGEVKEG